jgi:hypothetical protein
MSTPTPRPARIVAVDVHIPAAETQGERSIEVLHGLDTDDVQLTVYSADGELVDTAVSQGGRMRAYIGVSGLVEGNFRVVVVG